jgi:hypothetical protein
MDVFDAVDSRISCRWFLDKPGAVASATAAPLSGEAHIYRRSTAVLATRVPISKFVSISGALIRTSKSIRTRASLNS